MGVEEMRGLLLRCFSVITEVTVYWKGPAQPAAIFCSFELLSQSGGCQPTHTLPQQLWLFQLPLDIMYKMLLYPRIQLFGLTSVTN